MHAAIPLGRVHGVDIGANWSWLIVVGLITWSLAAGVFPDTAAGYSDATYVAMALVATAAFFVSLLLHELGHAVVAQREGMSIDGITLWVFGGVARFKGVFPSAGAEFRIAIAGPLVSVAIGAACLGIAALVGLPDTVDAVVSWLGMINIALVVFNMIPALPLDGGRVLRSILWWRKGDFARATRSAGRVADVIGRILIGWGIAVALVFGAVGGLWIALIGWFVLAAARVEVAFSTSREAMRGLSVADAMVRDPVRVPAGMSLSDMVGLVFEPNHFASYPVVDDGDEVIGILAMGDVLATPPEQLPRITAERVMLPARRAPTVEVDDDLGDAAAALLESGFGRALVTEAGHFAGLLSISDIERLTGGRSLISQRLESMQE